MVLVGTCPDLVRIGLTEVDLETGVEMGTGIEAGMGGMEQLRVGCRRMIRGSAE